MINLMPHQREAVLRLSMNSRYALAWDMGTGKTFAAIAAWRAKTSQPLLIVCLASAKDMWAKAVHDYCGVRASVHGSKDFDIAAQVVVTNFERLHKLPTLPWGAVIIDEAHRLKNRNARCTQAAYGSGGAISQAENVWLLSGTIAPNHPGELYSHAHALFGYKGSYSSWERRYCVTREATWGTQVVAGKNLDEMRRQLDPFMWRLRRDEVLTLPPLTIATWPLAVRKKIAGEAALRAQFDLDNEEGILALMKTINEGETLAQVRRETSIVKATAVADMLNEEDDPRQTLIFAHHHDAIDIVQRNLNRTPMVLTGKTPTHQRQSIVDQFNQGGTRYFVGQIQAAGASLNLQAAERVIFVEASWTPGDNAQAIARAYRNGQTKPVQVLYTYLPGSIDEAITGVIERKARMAFYQE